MTLQSALAAALLLAPSCNAGTRTVFMPPLSIEQHSFNDVDIWSQGLRKGVKWWKTDWSFCTRTSCEAYSTWNNVPGRGSPADCFTLDGTELCCMCLRGDASSRPSLTSPFNTSYDVLAFLADPANAPLYPPADSKAPVMLGFDWGGPNVDMLSGPAAPAIQALFLSLNATIARAGIGLRPYFDAGTSGWFNNLDQKCAAGQCAAQELQLCALPWPSEAGDALPMSGDPYGRFQIVNSDETSFENDCNTASWNVSLAKADGYPYLWYEPSSQIEMTLMLNGWIQCPNTPADKRDPDTGIVIVSNQASEMFEVYSSSVIGRGANALYLDNTHKSPRMALINTQSLLYPTYDRFVVVITDVTNSSGTFPTLFLGGIIDGMPPNASDLLETMPLQTVQGIASVHVYDAGVPQLHPLVLIADMSGAFTVLVFNSTVADGTALRVSDTKVSSIAGATLLSASWICDPNASNPAQCVVLALVQNDTTTAVAVIGVGSSRVEPRAEAIASALVQGALRVTSGSAATSLSSTNVTSIANSQQQLRSLQIVPVGVVYEGIIAYASAEGDAYGRSLVYIAAVQVNFTSLDGIIFNVTLSVTNDGAASNSTQTPTRVGFGAFPHVHTAVFNGTVFALVTNTDGLCQCGLLQNNDDTPHCLLPTPYADGNPFLRDYQSVQYLLNYNYGSVDAFAEAAALPAEHAFSMCSRRIMSGKFENGLSPTGALYTRSVYHTNSSVLPHPADVTGEPELSVLFMHDGDVLCPIITTAFCGSPLAKAGLVFDQFELVQPRRLE